VVVERRSYAEIENGLRALGLIVESDAVEVPLNEHELGDGTADVDGESVRPQAST
jgi:hypothetical protein